MRLKIIGVNFTTKQDWLYKLEDESGVEFYIMEDPFYKRNGYSSPITKGELDYFHKGLLINAVVSELEGKNVVLKIG